MSLPFEALTLPAVSLALDASLLRQQAIASHIAHAGTPGYRAPRLSFEAQLATAGTRRSGAVAADAVTSDALVLTTHVTPPSVAGSDDGPVRLDREVAALAQNSTHHQLLLRGLARHLSVIASAVSDGKR